MKITVVGLGYVGSVAAAGLASAGHQVLGVDVSSERISSFLRGDIPLHEPGLAEKIAWAVDSNHLRFALADEVAEDLGDVVLIATGTPAAPNGGADLSQVISAIEWVKGRQPEGGVIVVKSTVPPGTGKRISRTVLRGTGFEYVSNPEFLREGQAVHDWFHPDRVVIGSQSESAAEVAKALYAGIEAPIVVTDISSAEMIKYAANAFLATKISFINEIAMFCSRVEAEIDDVVSGIALDPRIGGSFLRAGVGYGGSCFPKDVRALDHIGLTNGHSSELLKSVITINNRQRHLPLYALRQQFRSIAGLRVGVLGLTFKPDTDDLREAPAMELIPLLAENGAVVKAYDPVAGEAASEHLPPSVRIADSVEQCAEGAEALILMTEWQQIIEADWGQIAEKSEPGCFIFDGRNVLDPIRMAGLGFMYQGVGRSFRSPVRVPSSRNIVMSVI